MKLLTDGVFYRKNEIPIVFFIYNRPELTKKTFQVIRNAAPKNLLVIADGPKDNQLDQNLVTECRNIVSNVDWDCEVTKVFSDINMGLRERLLSGLDLTFKKYESAIVIEDDCQASLAFFPFCEALLSKYQNSGVGLISGFNNGRFKSKSSKYFFSFFPEIWGWATWASVWQEFRSSGTKRTWSPSEIKEITNSLDSWILSRKLKKLAKNNLELDTWDIEFALFLIKNKYLTAIPNSNLIKNIGFGIDATHTSIAPPWIIDEIGSMSPPLIEPKKLQGSKYQFSIDFFLIAARSIKFILRQPGKTFTLIFSIINKNPIFSKNGNL